MCGNVFSLSGYARSSCYNLRLFVFCRLLLRRGNDKSEANTNLHKRRGNFYLFAGRERRLLCSRRFDFMLSGESNTRHTYMHTSVSNQLTDVVTQLQISIAHVRKAAKQLPLPNSGEWLSPVSRYSNSLIRVDDICLLKQSNPQWYFNKWSLFVSHFFLYLLRECFCKSDCNFIFIIVEKKLVYTTIQTMKLRNNN